MHSDFLIWLAQHIEEDGDIAKFVCIPREPAYALVLETRYDGWQG